ncbi:MAG TPA: alpha/beta hydrolase [Candidatus Acidoferrum sp.]|nr:alpha/beta hydrolase [Candidatus Acidoferrum sp.]
MQLFCPSMILFSTVLFCSAQMQAPIPLWPGGAPGALGVSSNDIPTLTPYLPDAASATGAAMVICPGGGYVGLAPHEGNDYALWLNQQGVAGFVLRYRLGPAYHHPAMLQDAARALRLVRARAADWKIDTNRVGIMGSSAGGHLASTLLTHFDFGNTNAEDAIERQSSRPDIGILCYAVISMGQYTHQGSKHNLLGPNPSPDLVQLLSNELQVTPNTPPCFIWTTFEDKAVPMENSLLFASALRKNNVPFALDIYQNGGHGMGLADKPPFAHPHPWAADCLVWLKLHKFVN